ncbi:transporter substrate-binding domain-containing protein [Billgrantia diversa]|uniref:transporter substrate-binding domain-containing protein n=1 Tax=Halomonas sp. MCCC 1A13316 TaxID=2733487 RepID=UPI003FA5D7E3
MDYENSPCPTFKIQNIESFLNDGKPGAAQSKVSFQHHGVDAAGGAIRLPCCAPAGLGATLARRHSRRHGRDDRRRWRSLHPPYEFLDEDGEPAGYNVELTQAIAELMGIEVRIELKPWSEVRRGLEQSEIDILQGMSYSEAPTERFDFSPPHAIVHQSIFARRGDPLVEVEELRGKEVIVQRGDIMHDYLV